MNIYSSFDLEALYPEDQNAERVIEQCTQKLGVLNIIFACANINLELHRDQSDQIQRKLFHLLLPQSYVEKIGSYCTENTSASKLFFRCQILDLYRQVFRYARQAKIRQIDWRSKEFKEHLCRALFAAIKIWNRDMLALPRRDPERISLEELLVLNRMGVDQTSARPHFAYDLARSRLIFEDILPLIDPNFLDAFQKSFGMTLSQYHQLASIIVAHWEEKNSASPLVTQSSFRMMGDRICDMIRFLEKVSFTLEQSLSEMDYRNATATQRFLKRYPLLQINSAEWIILDQTILRESLSIGPLFIAADALGWKARAQLFDNFGEACENYFKMLMIRMFPAGLGLRDRLKTNVSVPDTDLEIDAALDNHHNVVLFEFKSAFINDDCLVSPDKFALALRKKYCSFKNDADLNKNKGIGQLAQWVRIVCNRTKLAAINYPEASEVYLVLVVRDSLLSLPGVGKYFASLFLKNLEISGEMLVDDYIEIGELRVYLPIIITLRDIEYLQRSVENFTFEELLSAYSKKHLDRFESLGDYVITDKRFGDHLKHSDLVAEKAMETLGELMDLFKNDDKPPGCQGPLLQ